jgi:signal transduction histidine kinase
MRERLAAIDGTLTIDSAPGRGTCIAARLPVNTSATATTPEGEVHD